MNANTSKGFGGLRVLALESRRAREMAQLIENNGGEPFVAPSTKEIETGTSVEIGSFVSAVLEGRFDAVLFLTGVGTRFLFQEASTVCSTDELVAALIRIPVIARGPKPVAVLRELRIPIALTAPEPNTWREILQVLDENTGRVLLKDRRIAVQEYGVPNPELLAGLSDRGAEVTAIRVYRWALPDDVGPLETAVRRLVAHELDVVLFTASVQLQHLLEIAERMGQKSELLAALSKTIVGSIGPVTSAELKEHGVGVDIEPTHPKMGFLVKETADRARELLERKRAQ